MKQFTPFLCQELEQHLASGVEFLPHRYIDDATEREIDEILSICSAIRQLKSENNISKKHQPTGEFLYLHFIHESYTKSRRISIK